MKAFQKRCKPGACHASYFQQLLRCIPDHLKRFKPEAVHDCTCRCFPDSMKPRGRKICCNSRPCIRRDLAAGLRLKLQAVFRAHHPGAVIAVFQLLYGRKVVSGHGEDEPMCKLPLVLNCRRKLTAALTGHKIHEEVTAFLIPTAVEPSFHRCGFVCCHDFFLFTALSFTEKRLESEAVLTSWKISGCSVFSFERSAPSLVTSGLLTTYSFPGSLLEGR